MRKVKIEEYIPKTIRAIRSMLPIFAGAAVLGIGVALETTACVGAGAVVYEKYLHKNEKEQAPTVLLPPSVFEVHEEAISAFSPYTKELQRIGVPLEYVLPLASIADSDGKPYLSPEEIFTLHQAGVAAEEANILLRFTGKDSRPIFTAKQLIKTNENCSLDEAVALAGINDDTKNPLLTGFGIYRACQLDLAPEDLTFFVNSKKPNALLVYPTTDYNGAFESEEAIALFQEIQKAYDVKVIFAAQDGDIATAIDSVPDIELLILTGHGTTTTLNLGSNTDSDEKYKIDTSDTELSDALKKLHPDATIFLNSCSTGEYESSGNNLANFIEKHAEGRRVIAATEPFEQKDIEIASLYPFDIKIVRDVTYNTKKIIMK